MRIANQIRGGWKAVPKESNLKWKKVREVREVRQRRPHQSLLVLKRQVVVNEEDAGA